MSRKLTVLRGHDASYDDPIVLRAGGKVTLSGRTETWDGHRWLWAITTDGREGWIPDTLPGLRHGETVALADYSAVELTCAEGDTLSGIRSTHGWTWCVNDRGDAGWVPSRHLEPI
jgi:hypothetical protein